jgi:hypothetical protein
VVREDDACRVQLLHGREEARELGRIVEVGRPIAERAVDLGERGAAEAVLAAAEVDEDEGRFALAPQLGRERAAHVGHGREGAHHERERRGHASPLAALLPHRAHRHRVFPDGNRDPQRRAELQPHGAHRLVKPRLLGRVARGRHPVRRQLDVGELGDGRAREVGDGLGHRHARRGRGVEQRERRPLAHGHRLAGVAVVARWWSPRRRPTGHLPRAHHLVARHEPVTVRSPMVMRNVLSATVGRRSTRPTASATEMPGQREGVCRSVGRDRLPHHARRLAEQHLERHVDGPLAEVGVVDGEPPSAVASPSTAYGQRSRVHSSAKRASRAGSSAST